MQLTKQVIFNNSGYINNMTRGYKLYAQHSEASAGNDRLAHILEVPTRNLVISLQLIDASVKTIASTNNTIKNQHYQSKL